jgi:hypothetical protein
MEWYRNTLNRSSSSTNSYALWTRGGTGVIFDNVCNGSAGRCEYLMDTVRVYEENYGICSSGHPYETTPHPGTGTGFACRDAAGTGQDMNPPSGDVTAGVDQNDQSYSPVYLWSNTHEGSTGDFHMVNGAQSFIFEDRDYFLDASSHGDYGNGGVRRGLWADRPQICTQHQGYWATDRGGDWNNTTQYGGEDGALYVCDDANNWILHYTPAVYPHPLISSGTDTLAPAAPVELRVN